MFKKKKYKVDGILIKDSCKTRRCHTIVSARTQSGAIRKAKREFKDDLNFLLEKNYTLVINKAPKRLESKNES